MIYKILRYVIALLAGIASYMAADGVMPLLAPYIDARFLSQGDIGLTIIKVTILVVLSLLGVLIGYFISSFILNQGLLISRQLERLLTKVPNQELLAGTIGLLFGLIIANLIGVAFNQIPIVGSYIPIILSAVFGYIGLRLMARKGPEMYINYMKQRSEEPKKNSKFRMFTSKDNTSDGDNEDTDNIDLDRESTKLLDTSVIIDGRIKELCTTGFIEGPLVVPVFVLEELQTVSDSADSLKRNRGRRGLDILQVMQKQNAVPVVIVNDNYDDIHEVDSKLMRLALERNWKLMTNDFNLNKVARVQGISILNLNELTNALKPTLIAGEWIHVQVVKEGKEINQGVAYLDDGTMIVVEDGRPYIGQSIDIMVTSILQTSAGRMIFGRADGGVHES